MWFYFLPIICDVFYKGMHPLGLFFSFLNGILKENEDTTLELWLVSRAAVAHFCSLSHGGLLPKGSLFPLLWKN